MKIHEIEQGTDAWQKARLGIVTCSNMHKIISPTGKESTQAEKYMLCLIGEQLTGESGETWNGNKHSERGKAWEDEAAEYYTMLKGVELKKIGFCTTDDGFIGCSPDRFIADDGMLEIKTAIPSVMIEYYLSDKIEQDHRPQTQGGLYVTGRKWIDTLLYHPLMKPIIVRSDRNESYITSMSGMTTRFQKGMHDKLSLLRNKGFV